MSRNPRRGPQPQRIRAAVAGQVVGGQPDQGALDDRQLAVLVLPPGAAASRWCRRPQAIAVAVPHWVVSVTVAIAWAGLQPA